MKISASVSALQASLSKNSPIRITIFSLLAVTATMVIAPQVNAAMINEIQPNPAGGDPAMQDVELIGTPGESFNGVLISIELDNSTDAVDRNASISGTFDSNGLLTVSIPDLENPAFGLVLADAYTGTGGSFSADLATAGTTVIFDAVSTLDGGSDIPREAVFASTVDAFTGTSTTTSLGLIGSGTEPELIFRDAATGEFIQVAGAGVFDEEGNEIPGAFALDAPSVDVTALTFGAVNPSNVTPIPEPGAFALLFLGASAVGAVRMRRALR